MNNTNKINNLRLKSVKNRAKMTSDYIRIGFYDIEKVIKRLQREKGKKKHFFMNRNVKVKTSSQKNNIFISNYLKNNKKCKCDICGLEAHYFSLEKSPDNTRDTYHFNLYTILPIQNIEIYFNIDHIKPRAKGGTNTLDNMQLTCETCNSNKADSYNIWLYNYKIIKNIILKFILKIINKTNI